jgi:hypothetical protein
LALSDPGDELTCAQVTHQRSAQPALSPKHGIDYSLKHGLEWDILLSDATGCCSDSVLLLKEQLSQHLLLTGEVHVVGTSGYSDAVGNRRYLGAIEAPQLELLDSLGEQSRPRCFALS